jgi:hypothetical protein
LDVVVNALGCRPAPFIVVINGAGARVNNQTCSPPVRRNHTCRTMAFVEEEEETIQTATQTLLPPTIDSKKTKIIEWDQIALFKKWAIPVVVVYLLVGAISFVYFEKHNDHNRHPMSFLNGIYFAAVTLSTVGYGDYEPETPASKIFTCAYIVVGLSIIASGMSICAVDAFEHVGEGNTANSIKLLAADKFRTRRDDNNASNSAGNSSSSSWFLKLSTPLVQVFALALVCTFFVRFNEKTDWVDAFYFSVITLSSVGYGSLRSMKASTKIFLVFYVLIGVAVAANCLGNVVVVWIELRQEANLRAFVDQGITVDTILEMGQRLQDGQFCARS